MAQSSATLRAGRWAARLTYRPLPGYLHVQSALRLVDGKTLNRGITPPIVQHLLGNGHYEAIWIYGPNPRGTLDIDATLRVGSTFRYEAVYPKSAQ